MKIKFFNVKQTERLIYREDAVNEKLSPDEFKLYGTLHVEDQVTVAHLLLTLMCVDKAKALLNALTRKHKPVGTLNNGILKFS